MYRGTGPTANKFWKTIGLRSFKLEIGEAPHQFTLEDVKNGDVPDAFTAEDRQEIIAAYDPAFAPKKEPGTMTEQEVKDLLAAEKAKWQAEQYANEREEEAEELVEKKLALGEIGRAPSSIEDFESVGGKRAAEPNAKRRPGRPRKASGSTDSAGEVLQEGSE